jgi:hypothetical protein
VLRQEKLLRTIVERGERFPYDRLSSRASFVWGHALTFIGLGLLWDPMARVAWIVGGVSRLMLVLGPCDTGLFNRYPYRIVRNGFLLVFGSACIVYGLSGFVPILR